MKKFYKTIPGKCICYFLCVFSLIAFCISAYAAKDMLSLYSGVFHETEEEMLEGKLEDYVQNFSYDMVISIVTNSDDPNLLTEFNAGNAVYFVRNDKNRVVCRSKETWDDDNWQYTNKITVVQDVDGAIIDVIGHDVDLDDAEQFYLEEFEETCTMTPYTVQVSLKDGLPEQDSFRDLKDRVHFIYQIRYIVFVVAIISLIVCLVTFVYFMRGAGRRAGSDELHPGPLQVVPFDILLVIGLIGFLILDYCIMQCFIHTTGMSYWVSKGIIVVGGVMIILGLCGTAASRIKQKKFWKEMGVLKAVRGVVYLISILPLVWKTAVIVGLISLVEMIFLLVNIWRGDILLVFWIVEKLVLIPLVMIIALNLKRLQSGAKSLAEGDMEYHTGTEKMLPIFRKSAEDLNSISDGMALAVEEKLKSERMKTSLITNVSHDLKTPLTSIINYSDLLRAELKKEKQDSGTAKEYAEVLSRQSIRLKRLLEDLVEVSKAATGNLDVNLERCEVGILVNQVSGEYEEKLSAAQLELIVSVPDHELVIMADGRRMWRLFDNLLNNICKYSPAGSRVYLDLTEEESMALIVFKNISKERLNISAEELMERFVRGDASRHTEGNGLGLSIAKSMAEIQGGTLEIQIDGDLFKAIAKFPLTVVEK